MPLKQPLRDMSTVKCIKRSKDKNGEEKIDYAVLFDYVGCMFHPCVQDLYILTELFYQVVKFPLFELQEDPQWNLSEEILIDLKEIFMMFDTDVDGLLTIDQVITRCLKIIVHV